MVRSNEKLAPVSGVYVIRCLANGKVYVGSSKDMKKRVRQHVAKLRRKEHELPRLQNDWNVYGEGYFDFDLRLVSEKEMRSVECQLIEGLGALEHKNGYNKMIGGMWGPEARIRNTEVKLKNKGKYSRLRGVDHEAPIALAFIQSFIHGR